MKAKYFDGNNHITPEGLQILKAMAYRSIGLPSSHDTLEIENFNVDTDSHHNKLSADDKRMKTKARTFTLKYIEKLSEIIKGGKVTVVNAEDISFSSNSVVYVGGPGSGKTLLGCYCYRSKCRLR